MELLFNRKKKMLVIILNVFYQKLFCAETNLKMLVFCWKAVLFANIKVI